MLGLKDLVAIVAEHGEALDVALSPIKLTDEFTIADGRPALMGVVNLFVGLVVSRKRLPVCGCRRSARPGAVGAGRIGGGYRRRVHAWSSRAG